MKQKQLIGAVVAAVIAVNVVAFLLVKKDRGAPKTTAPTTTTAPAPSDDENQGRARRAAGVAALEAGEYDKALINFTEAKSLLGSDAKVDEMLKITQDLRNRQVQKAAEKEPEPVAVPPTPSPVAAPSPVVVAKQQPHAPPPRPTPARPVERPPEKQPEKQPERAPEKLAEARPTEAPAPLSSGTGMLLVSTTPRGLVVRVDGQATDLTPMRTTVKVGMHKIALYDGDRKLYEATVDVTEGQAATVLRDVSAEMAQQAAPVAPAPTQPTVLEPKPTEKPTVVAAVTAPEKSPAPAPAPGPEATGTGGITVTVPGLYGEIWVNGHSYGFPPATIEGLKAGSVKIDVRVNGSVKRSATVMVEAGQNKPVRVK